MRWETCVQEILDALLADGALTAVIGTNVFKSGERDHAVPAIEWFGVVRTEDELEEPQTIQFTLLARSIADLNTMETRVRAVVHHDTWRTLGSIYLRATFEAAEEIPSADGILGRALDFEVSTVRDQWA